MRLVWLFIMVSLFSPGLISQPLSCNQLDLVEGKRYLNNTLFTGTCSYTNANFILVRLSFENGLLHGDSAFSKFYQNGLCHTNISYDNGKALDTVVMEYFELVAFFAGYANGQIANRDSLITDPKMKVGFRKLSQYEIQIAPRNNSILDQKFDLSQYEIIKYTLSGGGCCYGGCLRDAICKNNNLSEFVVFLLKDERKTKYNFFDIYYKTATDTFKLSNITLKVE